MLNPKPSVMDRKQWYQRRVRGGEFQPPNLLRVALVAKGGPSSNVVYFTVLKRLTEFRFLASLTNMYCSEYEDIVLIIDSRAVTEVPVDWDMNKNLAQYRSITEGFGFSITGTSGFLQDGSLELTYDDLFFSE
eukprot:TRINITY_DN16454_c0_g1_i1.p1 TRINITY_DN16454_c0_g1~~TRINITY_DN16454_c0_g1_i1.p1  ORF type:complete len:133 (-),score=32.43 TRINITY_DN16454_c0_g1_i1:19-417(-)